MPTNLNITLSEIESSETVKGILDSMTSEEKQAVVKDLIKDYFDTPAKIEEEVAGQDLLKKLMTERIYRGTGQELKYKSIDEAKNSYDFRYGVSQIKSEKIKVAEKVFEHLHASVEKEIKVFIGSNAKMTAIIDLIVKDIIENIDKYILNSIKYEIWHKFSSDTESMKYDILNSEALTDRIKNILYNQNI